MVTGSGRGVWAPGACQRYDASRTWKISKSWEDRPSLIWRSSRIRVTSSVIADLSLSGAATTVGKLVSSSLLSSSEKSVVMSQRFSKLVSFLLVMVLLKSNKHLEPNYKTIAKFQFSAVVNQ